MRKFSFLAAAVFALSPVVAVAQDAGQQRLAEMQAKIDRLQAEIEYFKSGRAARPQSVEREPVTLIPEPYEAQSNQENFGPSNNVQPDPSYRPDYRHRGAYQPPPPHGYGYPEMHRPVPPEYPPYPGPNPVYVEQPVPVYVPQPIFVEPPFCDRGFPAGVYVGPEGWGFGIQGLQFNFSGHGRGHRHHYRRGDDDD